jgi:hypothetical protein
MHPAALPGGAEHHRADGLFESGVGVGDDQLHPAQPSGFEAAQERGPKRAVFGVADVEAEDLAAAVAGDPVAITTAWETTRWFTRALQ